MKAIYFSFIFLFAFSGFSAAVPIGGTDIGNGGDDAAFTFIERATQGWNSVFELGLPPELQGLTVAKILEGVKVVVRDGSWDIPLGDGGIQDSLAVNRKGDTLFIHRSRWMAIHNPLTAMALALHEVLGLVGVEGTGNYQYSKRVFEPLVLSGRVENHREWEYIVHSGTNWFELEQKNANAARISSRLTITKKILAPFERDPKAVFGEWLLEEMNHPSLMRDSVGVPLREIESNGRNYDRLNFYVNSNGLRVSRKIFSEKDLEVQLIGKSEDEDIYQASFRVRDGYRGGFRFVSFNFKFKAKFLPEHREYLATYPHLQGIESHDCEEGLTTRLPGSHRFD